MRLTCESSSLRILNMKNQLFYSVGANSQFTIHTILKKKLILKMDTCGSFSTITIKRYRWTISNFLCQNRLLVASISKKLSNILTFHLALSHRQVFDFNLGIDVSIVSSLTKSRKCFSVFVCRWWRRNFSFHNNSSQTMEISSRKSNVTNSSTKHWLQKILGNKTESRDLTCGSSKRGLFLK